MWNQQALRMLLCGCRVLKQLGVSTAKGGETTEGSLIASNETTVGVSVAKGGETTRLQATKRQLESPQQREGRQLKEAGLQAMKWQLESPWQRESDSWRLLSKGRGDYWRKLDCKQWSDSWSLHDPWTILDHLVTFSFCNNPEQYWLWSSDLKDHEYHWHHNEQP